MFKEAPQEYEETHTEHTLTAHTVITNLTSSQRFHAHVKSDHIRGWEE